MDVLELLKNEDDNPRGQHGGRFVSGSTLEEAAAAEQRKADMKSLRLPIGRQEAGILHLITTKSYFGRLRLPEPRWEDGNAAWNATDAQIEKAYDEAKRCCHPEWSFHPKRERGYEALREAYDTLSDRNGKRDAYVRDTALAAKEKEDLLNAAAKASSYSGGGGTSGGGAAPSSRAVAAAAAAATAAELEEQMAAKRKRMLEQDKLRRAQAPRLGGGSASVEGASSLSGWRAGKARAREEEEDDDDEADGYVPRAKKKAAAAVGVARKLKRPGMM